MDKCSHDIHLSSCYTSGDISIVYNLFEKDWQTFAGFMKYENFQNYCFFHRKKWAASHSCQIFIFLIFRCTGKVFAAEKMVAASGFYHRHCFRCVFCSQPLDSTSVCDGPDNKIYCRVCYRKLRGSSKPKFFDEANVSTHTIGAKDGEKTCPRCAGMVNMFS